MVKKSENATYNKTNNEKDGFNILKLRLIEYEKQRIDELNRFVFDLNEIKQQKCYFKFLIHSLIQYC
jgi:hypothetical protein